MCVFVTKYLSEDKHYVKLGCNSKTFLTELVLFTIPGFFKIPEYKAINIDTLIFLVP
jgi:hypothetical protein